LKFLESSSRPISFAAIKNGFAPIVNSIVFLPSFPCLLLLTVPKEAAMKAVQKWLILCGLILVCQTASAAGKASHVVLIVWDGMRPDFVSAENTPSLFAAAQNGVTFPALAGGTGLVPASGRTRRPQSSPGHSRRRPLPGQCHAGP
jgi:hypothetical protein